MRCLLLAASLAVAAGTARVRVSEANGLLNGTASAKKAANVQYAASTGAADVCVYGWIECFADAVLLPSTTAELAAAVTALVAAAPPPAALTIRASSSVFHSTAPFVCPFKYGGGLGSPIPLHAPSPPTTSAAAPSTAVVLQDAMRGVVASDPSSLTVLAGSRLWQVWEWAAERGLSPPRGVPSAWGDLSVGGAVAAGQHGAGAWGEPSGINDIVVEYTWVDGTGTVRVSPRASPEGRALAGGLGIVGLVSEVKLALTPLSKTVATTTTALPDALLAAEVDALGDDDNMALLWRPDAAVYNKYELKDAGLVDKTTATLPAATATGPSFTGNTPPFSPTLMAAYVAALQKDANDTGVGAALGPTTCALNAQALVAQQWAAVAHGLVPLPVGVGITNSVVTNWADPPRAAWSDGLSVDEIGFAIEADDFAAWVDDVKALIKHDLGGGRVRCAPIGTLLIRFGAPSDADISMTAGMRRPVLFALAMLRSRKLPDVPAKYAWIQDYMEQLTLCKYRGRPHWGKCFARTFSSPACPVRDLYGAGFDALLAVQAASDPAKIFQPPLFATVAGRGGPLYSGPGCATQKLCYCTVHGQCAPGWTCRASAAFGAAYRACVPAGLKWGGDMM